MLFKEKITSNHFIKQIVSGGQTGVDRAALDVAIESNISHCGWCPFERKAEDGVIPSKYILKEAPQPTFEESSDPDAIYKKRTELNAKDSDGTLIIIKEPPIGGTLYTIEMLKKHEKPFLVFDLSTNLKITDISKWILENNIHKLNVAGPRASQTEGIYNSAYDLLKQVINDKLLIQKKIENKSEKKSVLISKL